MFNSHTLGFLMAEAARLLRTAFEREMAESGLGVTSAEARALAMSQAMKGRGKTRLQSAWAWSR